MKLSAKNKDRIFIFCMLFLPVVHFLVFWVYVNIGSIALAFKDANSGEFSFIQFELFFEKLVGDISSGKGALAKSLGNTFITAGISMLVNMPMTIFLAFVMFKKFYGHKLFLILLYLPGIFGAVIGNMMNKYVYDSIGPIVAVLKAIGVKLPRSVLFNGLILNNDIGRTVYHVTSIGIAAGTILLILGALQKVPVDLFHVGRIEGMGLFGEFWHVGLPCAWSTVGIMWILIFASVWGDYSRPFLLTNGNYGTGNFGLYLFSNTLSAVQGTSGNYNYPAAIGVVLTCVIGPITLLLKWASTKIVPDVEF